MRLPSRLFCAPSAVQALSSQPTGSFTQAFTGLFHSLPAEPTSSSLSDSAIRLTVPKSTSIGSRISTASTLKKSCTVAAANARLNSAECRTWPSDTSVFVTVVPMLAPMIMGTASSTPTTPAATRPTITEVLADEDWTSTVPRIPTHRPAIGFVTAENSCSWVSAPMISMPASSEETPTRKM